MKILTLIDDISDPRMIGKVRHPLRTILFVALCGVLCGCESWDDIRDYWLLLRAFDYSMI